MSIADDLKSVTIEAKEAKKAMKRRLQVSFNDAAQAFFDKAPEGTTITWAQYTPYFNDGDACTFRVGSTEVRFKPLEGDDKEMAEEEYGEEGEPALYCYGEVDQTKHLPNEVRADCKALTGFINSQGQMPQAINNRQRDDGAIFTPQRVGNNRSQNGKKIGRGGEKMDVAFGPIGIHGIEGTVGS
jgi:hypothetical protein